MESGSLVIRKLGRDYAGEIRMRRPESRWPRSRPVGVQTHETAIEADCRLSPAGGFLLTPDVQYILRPGGTHATPNALFPGLKTHVEF